ncbi:radical SAM protein [candidate division KSB3 bacterium]|uniref:Radical SAM protein n=1 Tax=candidate division KSB3 bacterium TaxID=2044937 RepID=A0A9D5JZK6_9BACT|nr:radical SAM protein [candidate division KSB3 bacterium]MBD3327124.1 radical SAM protein [candidate division KSB3 bacterium]
MEENSMVSPFLVRMRTGLAMLGYNVFKIRRPLTSQILVTKHCNMDCKMCFVYPADKKEKIKNTPEPTYDQLEYLIEESCKLGAQVIIPFGGEPLLRNDIGKILQAIKIRNRYCILYTNGTFVEEKIEDLQWVDQLVISIDGDEATHDSIRGPGAYAKAIAALELALQRGLVCRLHTALIPDTLATLPHMTKLSQEYGVMLNYGSCDTTEWTKSSTDNIVLGRTELVEFLKEYKAFKQQGVQISTPAKVIQELIRIIQEWPGEDFTLSKREAQRYAHLNIPKCALAFSNIYIDSDGCAYPCLPLWGKEGKGPNVYDVGLKKAWDHYAQLDCHQCASIFTIEKSLFYSFHVGTLLQYLSGYQILRQTPRRNKLGTRNV